MVGCSNSHFTGDVIESLLKWTVYHDKEYQNEFFKMTCEDEVIMTSSTFLEF